MIQYLCIYDLCIPLFTNVEYPHSECIIFILINIIIGNRGTNAVLEDPLLTFSTCKAENMHERKNTQHGRLSPVIHSNSLNQPRGIRLL